MSDKMPKLEGMETGGDMLLAFGRLLKANPATSTTYFTQHANTQQAQTITNFNSGALSVCAIAERFPRIIKAAQRSWEAMFPSRRSSKTKIILVLSTGM